MLSKMKIISTKGKAGAQVPVASFGKLLFNDITDQQDLASGLTG